MTTRKITILTVVALGAGCSLVAQTPEMPALPKVPAVQEVAVTPNSSTQMLYHFLATGTQTYPCEKGTLSQSSHPKATLVDADANSHLTINHDDVAGKMVRWTMVDAAGKTVGAIQTDKTMAKRFANPDGVSIAWLRLDPAKGEGNGRFENVTVIQRLYTGGGNPTGTACATEAVVPYTAHYYFWGQPSKKGY